MKITEFLVKRMSNGLDRFYETKEDLFAHITSGEVKISVLNLIMLMNEYDEKFGDKLPSRFQLGDRVDIEFYGRGSVTNCEVIKVHFTESKVMYDLAIGSERLYNIDSRLVNPVGESNSINIEETESLSSEPFNGYEG